MGQPFDLLAWLRDVCDAYRFDVAGIFRRTGDHAWPLKAADADALEAVVREGGHLLPLPKEPAALANVLEVSIVDHIMEAVEADAGLTVTRGSERGYPDFELGGTALDDRHHAVDVKVARRRRAGSDQTQSRITLYTGNTYFRQPELHWPGTFRPFAEYASHLDVLMIYTLDEDLTERATDLEVIVQPAWRIASTQRSSTTREYIGAVTSIPALREGRGEFETEEAFYKFWRAFRFRISAQVQRQQERLLREQREEIERLRGHGQAGT